MSSDGSRHLLYYSPGDSTALSCCTQPRGFNSRWLFQEITSFLPPLFCSSKAGVPSPSAWPCPTPAQEHWQPKLTSLPLAAGSLPGAAARSRGCLCRCVRQVTAILGRLAQNLAGFLLWCCCHQTTPGLTRGAVPGPCFFQLCSVVFKRHLSASLKKSPPPRKTPKTNQKTQTKKKQPVRWRKAVLTKWVKPKWFHLSFALSCHSVVKEKKEKVRGFDVFKA